MGEQEKENIISPRSSSAPPPTMCEPRPPLHLANGPLLPDPTWTGSVTLRSETSHAGDTTAPRAEDELDAQLIRDLLGPTPEDSDLDLTLPPLTDIAEVPSPDLRDLLTPTPPPQDPTEAEIKDLLSALKNQSQYVMVVDHFHVI
jgi:hypothetical protein